MQDSTTLDDIYNLETYQYQLPPNLIAQYPVEPRDSSRLLVLNKQTGQIEDKVFHEVVDYLEKGDTLVINHTRVIPARLFAYKDTGAKVEILLLERRDDKWEALVKPARRMKVGTRIKFAGQETEAEVVDELDIDGGRLLQFHNCADMQKFLDEVGQMPLPPYIKRSAEEVDKSRYQTIYARELGSAAAPTAGLHFTTGLLEKIRSKGVNIAYITLHVGLGTFRPVSNQDIRQHSMHHEYFEVGAETAAILNQTRCCGGRIIGVGTTVMRTLETVYDEERGYLAQSGQTNKYIYPGYPIKAVDKLITNFHLPGSSLLMLVSALAGLENTKRAYQHAVDCQYRFFSYGDAMLIY